MLRYCCGVAFVVAFINAYVSGEDLGIPHEDYIQVFQDIPTLFEHIIEMLHKRPGMLEKNDISTFLEAVSADDDVSRLSSEENGLQLVKRETNFEDINDLSNRVGYDSYLLKASDDFGGFVGSAGTGARLTADEVAERMLMVERELEEYNNDTK